jgi:hypothetical protein
VIEIGFKNGRFDRLARSSKLSTAAVKHNRTLFSRLSAGVGIVSILGGIVRVGCHLLDTMDVLMNGCTVISVYFGVAYHKNAGHDLLPDIIEAAVRATP